MRTGNRSILLFAILSCLITASENTAATPELELTFEQRVAAQEAIERVYYRHQIGATRVFEEAMPRALLERKVRKYLKESVALEKFWRTPVTADALQNELERIARDTRFPERLTQIYEALGNDPILVQECFARASLVDRLARSFYASDQGMHEPARRAVDALHGELASGAMDPLDEHPARRMGRVSVRERQAGHSHSPRLGDTDPSEQGLELSADEFTRWRRRFPSVSGVVGPIEEEREAFVFRVLVDELEGEATFAEYSVDKVSWERWWTRVEGGIQSSDAKQVLLGRNRPTLAAPVETGEAAVFVRMVEAENSMVTCAPEGKWENGSLDDSPDARLFHSAIWTGDLMIVWGGTPGGYFLNTGSKYDPLTDTWSATSTVNAPSRRYRHSAVWSGSQMIVWGGRSEDGMPLHTGGRYDPITDSWMPTSTTSAPSGRVDHTAIWAGDRMVVWGGDVSFSSSRVLSRTGGRYDPVTDTWSATSLTGSPSARFGHIGVSTGSRMIVWGGFDGSWVVNTGGQYDPQADTWVPTSLVGAPSRRYRPAGVWTGSKMIVWGGHDESLQFVNTGSRYDPLTDTWAPTSTVNAPSSRVDHAAAWVAGRMVIWGGIDTDGYFVNQGGRYDPVDDSWAPTANINGPSERRGYTTISTGSLMIVWGGRALDNSIDLNTGGRYDPTADSWTPTYVLTLVSGSEAIWTGNSMIVWGGYSEHQQYVNTGSRYDPLNDTWTPLSSENAPSPRGGSTLLWTGNTMIAWGGGNNFESWPLATGGRYDLATDMWESMSNANAPVLAYPVDIWTGSEMIVWGDFNSTVGGRYNPVTDTWTPTSPLNAPTARQDSVAVWTGSRMVLWGGHSGSTGPAKTGGRYDPVNDTWEATSMAGIPSGNYGHTAVWTGSEMIVWGGLDYYTGEVNTGARYNPLNDTWMPLSVVGAPSPRTHHTAVWTGRSMIIWGGYDPGSHPLGTGGRYDLLTDSWSATSMTNAPSARNFHTSLWTESSMIVWGGNGPSGGIYDPYDGLLDSDGDGYSPCSGDCNDSDFDTSPAGTESCDGQDNDCDSVVDNGIPAPSGAMTVTLMPDVAGERIDWTSDPDATGYDVLRGSLTALRSSNGDFSVAVQACVLSDTSLLAIVDNVMPPPGGAIWYLTRARNCTAAGTYDSGAVSQIGSRDPGIQSAAGTCP